MDEKIIESQMWGARVDLTNMRIYFWGGIFSQWAKVDFKYPPLNCKVNCAEQAMMMEKAKMFGDKDALNEIFLEKNPRIQKELGRGVENFDVDEWDEKALDIVTEINYHKFTSNLTVSEKLILSHGYELVEASPYDKIWGIGLSPEDADVVDPEKWNGQNKLGKAIMAARKRIIEEHL